MRLTAGRKPVQTAKSVARKGITGNLRHLGGMVVNMLKKNSNMPNLHIIITEHRIVVGHRSNSVQ